MILSPGRRHRRRNQAKTPPFAPVAYGIYYVAALGAVSEFADVPALHGRSDCATGYRCFPRNSGKNWLRQLSTDGVSTGAVTRLA